MWSPPYLRTQTFSNGVIAPLSQPCLYVRLQREGPTQVLCKPQQIAIQDQYSRNYSLLIDIPLGLKGPKQRTRHSKYITSGLWDVYLSCLPSTHTAAPPATNSTIPCCAVQKEETWTCLKMGLWFHWRNWGAHHGKSRSAGPSVGSWIDCAAHPPPL